MFPLCVKGDKYSHARSFSLCGKYSCALSFSLACPLCNAFRSPANSLENFINIRSPRDETSRVFPLSRIRSTMYDAILLPRAQIHTVSKTHSGVHHRTHTTPHTGTQRRAYAQLHLHTTYLSCALQTSTLPSAPECFLANVFFFTNNRTSP